MSSLEDLKERVSLLELKIKQLERTISQRPTKKKRPYKWHDSVLEVLSVAITPLTKNQIHKYIISKKAEELKGISEDNVKHRLSSSYKKMAEDKKIIITKPKIKGDEDIVGLYSWYRKNDSSYTRIRDWYIQNDDYIYYRIEE